MKSAMTLIELLVVIGLVGIIAGIGYPNLDGWNCKQLIRNDFESLNNMFEQARAEAINRNQSVIVEANRRLPADGVTYRAFLNNDRRCPGTQGRTAIPNEIPNITLSGETTAWGVPTQCFHSDGTATGSQAVQFHEVRRACNGVNITYRVNIFSATGLFEKLVRGNNAWQDF